MSRGVQLRLNGEQAVIETGIGDANINLGDPSLGSDLTEELREWARVAATLQQRKDADGARVVSWRGRQLAGRLAATLRTPVRYRDPMTGQVDVVSPRHPVPSTHRTTVTPWGTGLVVSAFLAVFMFVVVYTLAETLATEVGTTGAFVGVTLVTGGVAPSLWLGRRVPVVRWIVLGATIGIGLAWISALFTV